MNLKARRLRTDAKNAARSEKFAFCGRFEVIEIVCIQGDQLDTTSLAISIDFLLSPARIVEMCAPSRG